MSVGDVAAGQRGSGGLGVKLATNPVLDELADYLRTAEVPWERVSQAMRERFPANETSLKQKHIPGRFYEMRNAIPIVDFATTHKDIDLAPVADNTQVGRFRFRHTNSSPLNMNLRVLIQEEGDSGQVHERYYSEEDFVIRAGELLAGLECKMQMHPNYTGNRDLNGTLEPSNINHRFQPFIELYPKADAFGFVVIVPQNLESHYSPKQNQFRESGGIIVATKGGYKSFRRRSIREGRRIFLELFPSE